jgi:hypothetical protein
VPTTPDWRSERVGGWEIPAFRPGTFPYAVLGAGVDLAGSFTSLRRFWAVAASRNSSDAPANPRRRSLISFRCRLR